MIAGPNFIGNWASEEVDGKIVVGCPERAPLRNVTVPRFWDTWNHPEQFFSLTLKNGVKSLLEYVAH